MVSRSLLDFIIRAINEHRRISNNSRILDVITRVFVVVLYNIDHVQADATITKVQLHTLSYTHTHKHTHSDAHTKCKKTT